MCAQKLVLTKMGLFSIIRISLAWGFGISLIVISTVIVVGLIFYPEAGQFALLGAFVAPFAFVIGTFLASLWQIKQARMLPAWGLVVYGLFLALPMFLLTMFIMNAFG